MPPNETEFHLPDGRDITVVQPGTKGSKDWRLNEAAFRRYEHHITTAVNNWPNETRYAVPHDMSPNTMVGRMRDALEALMRYGYNPDLQARLKAIRNNLVVSMDPSGTSVWIRGKQPRGRPVQMHAEVNERPNPVAAADLPVIPMPNETVLRAYAVITASKVNNNEPFLFHGKLADELMTELMETYNIGMSYDPATNITNMM